MSSPTLFQRLKERKLVQWVLTYLAGAWVIYEATGTAAEIWDVSILLLRSIHILLLFGLPLTLVLAWYHGEKGRQRVSGPELLIIALLLVIAGTGLSFLQNRHQPVGPASQTADEFDDIAETLNRMPGIAVLPFENRSGVPEDVFFTDGIQDDLLTRLQRVRGLRVISRTSTEAYRDTDLAIPEIAQELGVDYVVEGGVQRAGTRVRINVQLISALTDTHLWSDTYTQELSTESLFDIQSEIVHTVAGQLNIELRQEERLRAARGSTEDLEAYELYLRGIHLGTASEEALRLFERAIERDPEFIGAYVRLAEGHAVQYQYRGLRSGERAAAARAAAERAIELAPDFEEAQMAMGIYLYRVEKDYESALEWLGRASGTLVGDLDYHYYRAVAERRMGRWREAVASHQAAIAVSPRSAVLWQELGVTYLYLRRYREAEETLLEARRLNSPQHLFYSATLVWCRDGHTSGWRPYLDQNPAVDEAWEIPMVEGRYEEAYAILTDLPDVLPDTYYWTPKPLLEAETLEALGQREAALERYLDAVRILEPLVQDEPSDERYRASLARAYAGLGRRDDAVDEARAAVAIMPRSRDALGGPFFLFGLASIYARFGEVDAALEVLEDLLSAPSRFAPNMLEGHFRLQSIREDPRFQALMDRERDRVF